MQRTITIEQARSLYGSRTNGVKYTAFNGTEIVVFESNNMFIQVNTFPKTGRKEAFTENRDELCDDVFDTIFFSEEDSIRL